MSFYVKKKVKSKFKSIIVILGFIQIPSGFEVLDCYKSSSALIK